MARPVGVAPGGVALVAGWCAAYAIAWLTGAASVVVVLAILAVGAVGAVGGGWWRLTRAARTQLAVAAHTEVGANSAVAVRLADSPHVVHLRIIDRGDDVASGWVTAGGLDADACFTQRGVIDHLETRLRTAGVAGLVSPECHVGFRYAFRDIEHQDQRVRVWQALAGELGAAVVLVTHEPRFSSWADRVVFMRDGVVVDQTAPLAGAVTA